MLSWNVFLAVLLLTPFVGFLLFYLAAISESGQKDLALAQWLAKHEDEARKLEHQLEFRACPVCAEEIRREARKCKHCGEVVEPDVAEREPGKANSREQCDHDTDLGCVRPNVVNVSGAGADLAAKHIDHAQNHSKHWYERWWFYAATVAIIAILKGVIG